METNTWLFSLKETLPTSSCPWVISALKHDRVVWESLREIDFAHQAVEFCGDQPSNWSPAILALLALGQVSLIPDLHTFPVTPLDPGLRQKAARAYETLIKREPFDPIEEANSQTGSTVKFEPGLAQSGLVALALRERFRVVGSWTSLTHELRANHDVPLYTWQTPMACLFGMLPDPVGLLRAMLFPNAPDEVHSLAVHTLLSNPFAPEEALKILQATLARKTTDADLQLADRLALLRQVAINRPHLVKQLAEWLLTLTIPSEKAAANDLRTGLLEKINTVNYRAELHYHAEHFSQSLQMYEEARKTAQMLQANLVAEWASIATQAVNSGASETDLTRYDLADIWEKAAEMDSGQTGKESESNYHHYLSLALLEAGDQTEIYEWLSRIDEVEGNIENQVDVVQPEILLALSHWFLQEGNQDRARQLARMALEAYKTCRKMDRFADQIPASRRINLRAFSEQITRYLHEINLIPECVQAARLTLEDQPANLETHLILGKALFHLGQYWEATTTFQLAALLSPEIVDIHRQLADSLEAVENWEAALEERKTVLHLSPPIERTQVVDLRALANCALHTGQFQQTVESCQQALSFGEDDWQATILLGKALLQLGNTQASLEHLTRAVHLAPNNASPWLEMSAALRQAGDTQKAVDTLRSGIQAVPESSEIHLGLGEALLHDGLPTQALPALQRAYEIAVSENLVREPSRINHIYLQIALRLGQTLHQLGHPGESRKVLEKAYLDNQATGAADQPELSYAYAQTLVTLNDPAKAIPILANYLKTGPEQPEPYLMYASSLLIVGETPDIAVQALQHVLSQHPTHLEAQAMLAEALFAANDYPAAIKLFLTLLESELVKEPTWQARLSYGLGRASLALGQVDTAAVAFQEAVHLFPDNPIYHRALAEAYWAANLFDDGWSAARTTLQLDSTNLDNLLWFSEHAITCHQEFSQVADENLHEKSASNRETQPKTSQVNSQQLLSEALEAFDQVRQLANQRGDLLVQIGRLQLLSGDPCAAHESFRQSISIEKPAPKGLHHAARYLLEIGDVSGAITALEQASDSLAQNGETIPLEMIIDHAKAYRVAKELPAARIKLEKAIEMSPMDAGLYQDLSEVLLLTDQIDEAVACLNKALQNIQDPTLARSIHFRAALTHRLKGNLVRALNHAEQALPILNEPGNGFDPQQDYAAHALAGELARALLQPERARRNLKNPYLPTNLEEAQGLDQPGALEYHCLNAELALEAGEDDEAENSLRWAIKASPKHPRTLANQARILYRQGKILQAQESLQESNGGVSSIIKEAGIPLPDVPPDCDFPVNSSQPASLWRTADYLSVSEAAGEMKEWDPALSQVRQAIKLSTQEPFTQLSLARILTLRAEFAILCQDMDILTHGPGSEAISEASRIACFTAIQAAEQELQNAWLNRQTDPEATNGPSQVLKNSLAVYPPLLARWICRSQAIFSLTDSLPPSKEPDQRMESVSWSEFTLTPDDIAARISYYRHQSASNLEMGSEIGSTLQSAMTSAQLYPKHPQVMVQVCLALEESQIQDAIIIAHALTNILANQPGHPLVAPSHALLSRISQRIQDYRTAAQEIEQALSLWPDEPRWHALAASISRSYQGEQEPAPTGLGSAILHLEEAVKLDPRNLQYYLDLGNAYLEASGQDTVLAKKAIRYLERASRIAPTELHIWRALAEAYLQAGSRENLDQAAECTEKAIFLSYQVSGGKVDTWPHLLRARIALKLNDPQEAYRRASEAADLDPTQAEAVVVQIDALEAMGHLEDALEILEKAIPFVKEKLRLKLKQANLLRNYQGIDAALKVLGELAETNPHDPAVLAAMARTLAEAGDPEAAIQAAQMALQDTATPENNLVIGSVEKAELHCLLGALLNQVGQLDQAIYHLKQAVQLQPGYIEPYLTLGYTYQKQRQFLKAQKAFEEAVKNAPDDYRAYYQVGLALKDGKDYQGSERMLRRAAELAPNDVNIRRQLAAVVAINLIHNPQTAETQPAR